MKQVWLISLLLFAGCSSIQPHIVEYKIAPNIDKIEIHSLSCKTKSLKVGRVFSSSELMSQNMRYTKGSYKEFFFTESKWAITPNSAISSAFINSINAQNIFANVSSFKSRSRSDLILETNIEDFMQYFANDTNSSYVKIAFTSSLVDSKKNKVIDTIHLVQKLEVPTVDAEGGVKALNKIFSKLLQANNEWLAGSCK